MIAFSAVSKRGTRDYFKKMVEEDQIQSTSTPNASTVFASKEEDFSWNNILLVEKIPKEYQVCNITFECISINLCMFRI